jgi:hypothetical protein
MAYYRGRRPPPILKPDLSSLSLNDDDNSSNNLLVPPGNAGDEERNGSRKRRALSSVDFATEVAVVIQEGRSKADVDEEVVEKEESETDIGEDFNDEDEDGSGLLLSGSFSFDGETPPHSSNKSSSSSTLIARVGAKIRRLNLTQDDDINDDGAGDDVDNIDDAVGGLAGWFRESSSVKKKKKTKRQSIVVEGGGGARCPPPSPAIGRGERFITNVDCSDLSRRIGMNDRMTTDDVSPRDVINFPSFATKINSPSQPLLHDNDDVIAAAAAGDNYDGKENTGDEYNNNPSPPSSAYKLLPPSSTMKSTKARRRIFDDDLDDKMVVVTEDRPPRSSPPPRPQGLRTLGRANSFLQMFSFSSVSSDTIIEEETTSPVDNTNCKDNVDDFIRRPDYNGGERLINDINMDFAITHPSSPQRPIRNTHHRRYTPASPASGKDDDKCGSDSFSRFVSDFEIVGTLGNGSFGSVYSVRNRTDRRLYAIKAAKREARGLNDRDRMLQEVFALSSLSDKACISSMHIVRYHQAWMEGNRLYIQTELCDGTLLDEMKGGVVIDEQGRYKLLREILLALKLVHESGMIHLDIKPENIFRKSGMYKLGDFGLVSKIENHDDVEEGDSRYMSLELLRGELDDLTKVRHHETHASSNIQFNNKSHVPAIIDTL